MFAPEQQEAGGKKSRITGQTNPGWLRTFGVRQAEDAMIEPVVGNVAVYQRIAGDVGKFEVEQQPQSKRSQGDQQEVFPGLPEHAPERPRPSPPWGFALRFDHVANIAVRWD